MFSRRENLGLLLAFVGVVLFGGTLPATRLAVQSLDPWFVTFARAAIAGTAALALLLAFRSRVPPRDTWVALALVALGSAIGFPLLTALAMQTVPAAHGGVVVGILPLATTIAGAWIAHERPSAGFWLTALAGTALVVTYALWHGDGGSFAAGDLYLLLGIATGAIQVPGSGQPILLLADHQTTGGYPKIATVISADIPVVGRRKPGDPLRFTAVDVAEAERLRRLEEAAFQALVASLAPLKATGGLDPARLFEANLISGVVFDEA